MDKCFFYSLFEETFLDKNLCYSDPKKLQIPSSLLITLQGAFKKLTKVCKNTNNLTT